jgi:S1-C subfamily serine protease
MMHLRPLAAAILLATLSASLLADKPDASPGAAPVPSATPNLRVTNEVRVYQLTKDAVVNISSTRIVTARVGTGDEIFDRFFGGQIRQVPAQSLGSGFVIHASGYIITNEHVVDQASDVQVQLSSGDKLEAEVLATDNEHDLAVLKVTPKKPLATIELGASEDLMIGEPVYAIGNPFGYAGTMTRGIVSAVNRTLDAGPNKSYKGLIQTDASINPGNSGGPLINAYGQVVGINTAIRAEAHGIGFAIGVSNMRDLLPSFLNPTVINRAEVGFTVQEKRDMTPPAVIAAAVTIKSVQPGTGAEKAGLQTGDVILKVGTVEVRDVVDALVAMASVKPGDKLPVTVSRHTSTGTQQINAQVAVGKAAPPAAEQILLSKMGVEGVTVTPALAKKENLAVDRGVLVRSVKDGSPAAVAGLKPGDIMFQLGPYYVNSLEDMETLLKTVTEEVEVRVGIIRGNARGHGTVKIK